MTKPKHGEMERSVGLDLADECEDRLRSRGILILDGDEVNVLESGLFYRELFFLASNGWPKDRPIWIILNSPGGHASQCFAICDTIRSFIKEGYTINIFCLGHVASAATILLQTASRRYSAPNTRFLVHQVRQQHVFLEEEVSQGEERVAEMVRINTQACAIIAERVGMDLQDLLTRVKKTDLWLSADEAMKFGKNGLIDEICPTFPFLDLVAKPRA